MNHIQRLIQERDEARAVVLHAERELLEIVKYLTSDKFHWPERDYVFVRTDILPKVEQVRFGLIEGRTA